MDTPIPDPVKQPDRPKLLQVMGPGLITGASDDDPSGIATYSQIGAKFGYGLAWTMLLSYPLMVAIQEISARIGRITGYGIAGNLRRHYPAWLSSGIVGLLLVANIINLGADLGAMGAALKLLIDGSPTNFAVRNISEGGVMGDQVCDLTPGAKVHVRFEGGVLVPAVVKWIEDGHVGLAFIDPIILDRSDQQNS